MALDVKDNKVKVNNSLVNLNIEQEEKKDSNLLVRFYDDAISPTISCIKTFFKFLGFKVIPIIHRKSKEIDYILKQVDDDLEQKYNKIPADNRVEPRLSIVGNAIDVLKYNIDEEHIRKMFVNILLSEMDNRKQKRVLPAYTEIIKQLSKDDAKLLRTLKEINRKQLSLLYVKLNEKDNSGYINLDTIIVVHNDKNVGHTVNPKLIVLENLERLNIVKMADTKSLLGQENDVENAFKFYKSYMTEQVPENYTLGYEIGVLEITDFGMNFIDICCS